LPDQTPIYFISPIAKEALSYAQIYPECLSEQKQNKASNPEFPFAHDDAIETGKLKVFEYSAAGLSNAFKGPCVIFSGHPSLELGESRKWATDWCKNKDRRNKIIVTEPGLPLNLFNDTERNHVVHYLPIDTRMTSSATKILLEDLKPKELVISADLLTSHPKLREGIIVPNVVGHGATFQSKNPIAYKMVNLDPGIGKQIQLQPVNGTRSKIASVSGTFKIQDGICQFQSEPQLPENKNLEPKMWGVLNVSQVLRQLNVEGFKDVEVSGKKILVPGGFILLQNQKSQINHCDPGTRARLVKVLRNSLQT